MQEGSSGARKNVLLLTVVRMSSILVCSLIHDALFLSLHVFNECMSRRAGNMNLLMWTPLGEDFKVKRNTAAIDKNAI